MCPEDDEDRRPAADRDRDLPWAMPGLTWAMPGLGP
jgi:hypothetical protein